jgi:hypothetical protein
MLLAELSNHVSMALLQEFKIKEFGEYERGF